MDEETPVHPDCRNASNPYHECSEYCFRIIAEAKAHSEEKKSVAEPEQANTSNVQSYIGASKTAEDQHYGNDSAEVHSDDDDIPLVEEKLEEEFTKLTGRKKKLFELRLKMNEARKANQIAMVNVKKGMESPTESRGVTKQKWLEERKKKIGKLLDANGLDLSKAYMLDTQVAAENKYKKWEKDPAPYGWDEDAV
ncbi:hypothetical protein SAY86_002666 [Trapa natans]|uniref:Uncharacterized protein n=1 Tax=Trapa natans TaxID=22666 RepID=A0AAN7LU49_TRANT|nr:hypothetical protein SAY86_002666 [Trapa natans]